MNASRIEELEKKMRERIKSKLKLEVVKDIWNNESVTFASMPLISETRHNGFPDKMSLHDFHEYIYDKVYNYFYSEIFEFMRELEKDRNIDHMAAKFIADQVLKNHHKLLEGPGPEIHETKIGIGSTNTGDLVREFFNKRDNENND